MRGFEKALQEYDWHLRNPYEYYGEEEPELIEEEDPEVDRRLEDR